LGLHAKRTGNRRSGRGRPHPIGLNLFHVDQPGFAVEFPRHLHRFAFERLRIARIIEL
jgi:hypothetical protein